MGWTGPQRSQRLSPAAPGAGGAPARDPLADGESCLWRRWRLEADRAAHRALVELHAPFARGLAARSFARRVTHEVAFDDYVQLAMVGLLESIERFVPGGEAQFRTFALRRIQGAIHNGLSRWTERQQQASTRRRLEAERIASLVPEKLTQASGEELLAHLGDVAVGVAVGLILEAVGLAPGPREVHGDPYAQLELRQLREQAWRMVDRLPERERLVIELHYRHARRFDEIARKLEVTKGRISQIHRQALVRLRGLVSKADRCNVAF